MEGRVRWYSAKGFGFIDPTNGGGMDADAYYFHLSVVAGLAILKQGQQVTFDPTTSPKGLRAVNVQVVETKELNNEPNTNNNES